MKRAEIKIGAKSKSQRAQLVLMYSRPESTADCLKLVEGNELALASLFNRGLTIWLQDRLGRPMFEAGADGVAIQNAIDGAIPGKTKGVSKTKAPIVVTIQKGKKSFSPEEVAAMLASRGIKTVTE